MDINPHIVLNALLLARTQSFRRAGIHKYIYNTLHFLPLVQQDWQYSAVVIPGVDDVPDNVHPIIASPQAASPMSRILWEQTRLPGQLRQLKPTIFHSMAYSLPVLSKIPSIVTIYDLSFFREPERLTTPRRIYLQNMVRYAVRHADRILAISEAGKRELTAVLRVSPKRISVAYPGVDPQCKPAPEDEIARFKAQSEVPERFILHVGTIEPRKNLPVLVRAYADLSNDIRDAVKLVLIGGKGWQTEPLFALIEKLGLEANIVFPGYVPDEDLPLWYGTADLFAYPSVYEGFGIPIVEAMACGTPIIASNTSSLPEAAGPHSILLPPDDAAAWGQAITKLLEDSAQRQQIAQEGLRYVKKFTWQNTAASTVDTYQKLLNDLP